MKTKFILFVACLISGTVLFSSCSGDDDGNSSNSIVGTWVIEKNEIVGYYSPWMSQDGSTGGGEAITCNGAEVWTFTSDNSWIYTHENYVEKGSDAEDYFGKSGTIVKYYYGEGKSGMYQYTNPTDGGILTLYAPDGSIATYNKELAVFKCTISKNTMNLVSKKGQNTIQFKKK